MSDNDKAKGLNDINIDIGNLHREEMITDLKVGSIQRLIPIKPDGTDDPSRPVQYIGQTQILTQMGPLPINAPIEAENLQAAIEKFPEALRQEIERLRDMAQRQQIADAGRIALPKGGMPGMQGPGGAGRQGGGNIII